MLARSRILLHASFLGSSLLWTPGCSTPATVRAGDAATVPMRETFGRPTDPGAVRDDWLATFADPRLPSLIAEAQQNNPNLAVAAGRLDEARARAKKAGAGLTPRLSALSGASAQDAGARQTASARANLGLNISWEADVWGRLRQGRGAAEQDALSAAADYEFARQSLAAQTAEAWFFAISARAQTDIDRDVLSIYEKTLVITEARHREGVASRMEVDLAAGNVSNAKQNLARSEGSREDAVRSIEVLLGRYPGAELEVATELPPLPGPVPTGLPSGLLERRPDVIAADRRVGAAFHRTGSARAARMPGLSISADLGMLLNPSAAVWSLGANLLAPIADGGERAADVGIAEGQQKQALGEYVRTAINGFQEVETALANETVLAERERELRAAAERYGSARRAAEASYLEGAMTLVDLNTVQSQEAGARAELLKVMTERLRQRIKLHLALGGSFEAAK